MGATKLSTKGQVVVPLALRRQLGLRPGDVLEASLDQGTIRLTPARRPRRKARILKDPISGLPVLSSGRATPKLTSEMVATALADFP